MWKIYKVYVQLLIFDKSYDNLCNNADLWFCFYDLLSRNTSFYNGASSMSEIHAHQ